MRFYSQDDDVGILYSVFILVGHLKPHSGAEDFQALRIEVNNEMPNLQKALESIFEATCDKGRIVVVSYHSLEDRIVKNFFRNHLPVKEKNKYPKKKEEKKQMKSLTILTKKPVLPEISEIKKNRRARSAKLRAAEVCL